MTTTEAERREEQRAQKQPPKAVDLRPFSKEVRELLRSLKQGFKVERTGGGHYRIRDRHGKLVKTSDGKNLTITTDPSPGVVRALREQLTEARVLRGTEHRELSDAAQRQRTEALRRASQERDAQRQIVAKTLRDRLDAALRIVGGLDAPQRSRDLGYAGVVIAREQDKQMTPDLLATNALRVIDGGWVESKYQEVWNALAERLERAPESGGEWYSLIRQARGLPADVVELRVPESARDEWPFRVELLSLDRLLVDETYQRPVSWPFVRREAARFDHALVGTIDVAQRAPSRYAILDGQQRVEIVRLVGKNSIWCSIYEGLDVASEARFFLHKNRDRKNVHPYYTFKARVVAHDSEALEIERLVEQYGYRIAIGAPRGGLEDQISAITSLEVAYRLRRHGDDSTALAPVLRTLYQATRGREYGQASGLIRGLATLYADTDADESRVIDTLATLGPTMVLGRASDVSRNSGVGRAQAVARVLAAEYDRHAERGQKLKYEVAS